MKRFFNISFSEIQHVGAIPLNSKCANAYPRTHVNHANVNANVCLACLNHFESKIPSRSAPLAPEKESVYRGLKTIFMTSLGMRMRNLCAKMELLRTRDPIRAHASSFCPCAGLEQILKSAQNLLQIRSKVFAPMKVYLHIPSSFAVAGEEGRQGFTLPSLLWLVKQ